MLWIGIFCGALSACGVGSPALAQQVSKDEVSQTSVRVDRRHIARADRIDRHSPDRQEAFPGGAVVCSNAGTTIPDTGSTHTRRSSTALTPGIRSAATRIAPR
jgi:hypothetical protein